MSLVRFRPKAPFADVAHLVERHLAKVEVAGSSPVIRSKKIMGIRQDAHFLLYEKGLEKVGSLSGEFKQSGGLFKRPWACRQAGSAAERAPSSAPYYRTLNRVSVFCFPGVHNDSF